LFSVFCLFVCLFVVVVVVFFLYYFGSDSFSRLSLSDVQVVTLWGEDPAVKPPDEFFQIWQELIINVTAATNNIVIEREKAEKLAKREALRKPPMGKPLSSVIAGGGAGDVGGDADGGRGRGRGRGRGT
jgi:hypothetical protein